MLKRMLSLFKSAVLSYGAPESPKQVPAPPCARPPAHSCVLASRRKPCSAKHRWAGTSGSCTSFSRADPELKVSSFRSAPKPMAKQEVGVFSSASIVVQLARQTALRVKLGRPTSSTEAFRRASARSL